MGGRGASSPAINYVPKTGEGLPILGQGYDEDDLPTSIAPEAPAVTAATAQLETPVHRLQTEQVSTGVQLLNEADLPHISIINQETALGGAIYPFLEQTGRAWTVVSHDLNNPTPYPRDGTFGMSTPTLRYVKDGRIEDIFVDGMTTEQFLAKTGLQLSMNKGGFVMSKRLSRMMRPYFATGSFDSTSINVRYLEQDEVQKKIWDGAGLISRNMLERLTISDNTPPAKRAELLREIGQCKRVEFTIMTAHGQDKGHAIVSDNLDVDFVLPQDTKSEVKLVTGQTWIGVNFVHAHDEMRIDIQSLINLHPFFSEEQYAQWLADEGKLFAHAVESGQVDAAMQRIDPYTTLENVEAWHLREYFASGGHALWSASVTRNLMNQHLKRLNETTLEKMRLPIPGGRYYVMPIGVGHASGMDHDVPRGYLRIDPEYATAWVNDEDWIAMQDSPTGQGIRDILGGADNDDALWVHPFTDHDGVAKMLCWRSPNQAGEYVILKPTIGSRVLAWDTVDGETTFPPGDSRQLFARTDTVQRQYLGLIDPNSATGLGKGKPYSIEVMDETLDRARANAGGLGMYCNMLMLSKALYGGLPKNPPAPLEDFIDSSVKTGADVSEGRAWCYSASQQIIASGRAVPQLLVQRLAASREGKASVPLTRDHWLDTLYSKVKAHIEDFRHERAKLVKRTMPPRILFDHAFNSDERQHIQTGIALNKLYNTTRGKILHSKRAGQRLDEADIQVIRDQLDHFLSRFDESEHGAILRGAMVATYLSDEPSDAALWIVGAKSERGTQPGMAQKTIRALREIGILDEIGTVDGGVVRYPGATISEPTFTHSIGIQGVWFNWYCQQRRAQGLPVSEKLSDVPKAEMKAAKAKVAELAQSEFQNMPITIRRTSYTSKNGKTVERLGAFNASGELLGLLMPYNSASIADAEQITLQFVLAVDGNLQALWSN